MDSFLKQPYEEYPIEFDFSPRMPNETTLASCAVTARLASDGTNSPSILSNNDATITGKVASVGVKGGIQGQDYIISFRGVLSPSGKVEGDVLMRVREE